MPAIRQRIWAVVFALFLALMVGSCGYAAQDLDIGMLILILIPAAIIVMILTVAVTGLVAWQYRFLRAYFVPVNLAVLMVLMAAFTLYFFERTKFPEEFAQVKAYVTQARPALDLYCQQHGHYPDSLDQLRLTMAIPSGLQYRHILNADDNNWVSWASSSVHGPATKEIYIIDFYEAHLCPDGNWFVDN